MKFFTVILCSLLFSGCTKKDVIMFLHYSQQNRCTALSLNPEKQGMYDFYALKTVDENGLVRHIKTQLRDINGSTRVLDYDITYLPGKAIFEGSTKVYEWLLDNPPVVDPNGPIEYPEPDAPVHAKELTSLLDKRKFEIYFDRRSGNPTEVKYTNSGKSELSLAYDKLGRLTRVGAFNVINDNKGNIVSILTPPDAVDFPNQTLGVWYAYNNNKDVSKNAQYYEAPFIFVHPIYSLLEVLNWGNLQPKSERTNVAIKFSYEGEELPPYIPSPEVYAEYSNHQYDKNGNLVSYHFSGDLSNAIPYYRNTGERSRKIIWSCHGIK